MSLARRAAHSPVSGESTPHPEVTVVVLALALLFEQPLTHPLGYSLDELTRFCAQSAGIAVTRNVAPTGEGAITVLVGRSSAELQAPDAVRDIDWARLGTEGYLLRRVDVEGKPVLIAAGATDAGTRHAVYDLMCSLDLSAKPARLPEKLHRTQVPTFGLRGMYAHQHWAYNHPYALRTWSIDEWKRYVDLLAVMRVNLFQIWSMAGILPVPLSKDDEAFLRRYPPVIDHAQRHHGMTVFIGECANNVCETNNPVPAAQRQYFDVEALKDPGDPEQMKQLRAAREAYYRICDNADGYWVLDSDPGKWDGSPSSEFVNILMMNRELIDTCTKKGREAKLVYWMWFGWGTGEREDNWRNTLAELKRRNPQPWWMTVAWEPHWKIADAVGVGHRIIYYPYGSVEPEPSLPFTTVVPQNLRDVLDVTDRADRFLGIMGNAQTPLVQLPNIYFFARSAWDLDTRTADRREVMRELARLVYPQHAKLLTDCWMAIADNQPAEWARLADELEALASGNRLGPLGPIGRKLFTDGGQAARDLAMQLRIHGTARDFIRMAGETNVDEAALLKRLEHYCLLSLAWRRHTGFRAYGTNGYDFFPLRDSAHKHWWRGDHLDREVYAELEESMKAAYEPWEAELILYPLNH